MNDIYYRFFSVKTGSLMEEYAKHRAAHKKAISDYQAILQDIGAIDHEWLQLKGKLIGIRFESTPNHFLYKKVKNQNAWYPKRNTRKGKKLHERIKSVSVVNIDDLLPHVGLERLQLFTPRQIYLSKIIDIPSETEPELIIKTPWADVSPKKLEAYRETGDTSGSYSNDLMKHLLWTPPAEAREIKSWEVEEIIQAWNQQFKKKQELAA